MPRGGFRPGSGRKSNSGLFREKTVVRRVPLSVSIAFDKYIDCLKTSNSDSINDFLLIQDAPVRLPLFSSNVAAGFPAPADSDIEAYLDLNAHLIPKPVTSFCVRVSGESMVLAGINDGDILIVDRSLEAKSGSIVIAVLNGELTVKRLKLDKGKCYLKPENDSFEPIEVAPEMDFSIWGVVTSVIHQFVKV
jgi:DNA polymerase V